MKPDGTQALVLTGGETKVWRPGTGPLGSAPFAAPGLTWSPDGKRLAASDSTRIVRLLDAETGAMLRLLGKAEAHDEERQNLSSPSSTAFSPDGKQLAVARWDQATTVWDLATGNVVRTLPGTLNVVWSPDGKKLAVDQGRVSKRMTKLDLVVLDAATGTALYTAPFPGATFSPDGRFLAALSEGAVVLLDAKDGSELARYFAEGHQPESFAFSPDGKVLATGGGDASIRIWPVGQ